MAVFKCKMCGGELTVAEGMTVAECDYCGTKQTLPKPENDRQANLYDRANHFRRNNEFDKAMGIYEQILNENAKDAEAYWSIILCRYGIEYVEDPATHKRVPTVNRSQYTSVFDDDNYKSALLYADDQQKLLYQAEATEINRLQKEILAISRQEEPFDVFICYKETDKNGRRTPDSVLAQELYFQLTKEGFRVFFSRITLEDKLGSAYEPYIFAALHSARVMVVLGTRPEHFNAVWVKNEWSRYLMLIKSDRQKVLIPAYKDMDPYDLPEEFSHLQAQDMSKLGFMQDLIRGIGKLARPAHEEPQTTVVKETVVAPAANTAPLLKRAFMFLEDGEWDRADEFCEQVLNQDPECAEAYLGKLMAELHSKTRKQLQQCEEPFDKRNNYQKAIRFGDEALKNELEGYIAFINTRNENARLEGIYAQAAESVGKATNEKDFLSIAALFESISGYKDADALRQACIAKAETARKNEILLSAKQKMWARDVQRVQMALQQFESIAGWKDADEQRAICIQTLKEYAEREEQRRKKELHLARLKKKLIIGLLIVACLGIAVALVLHLEVFPGMEYDDAMDLIEAGKYRAAITALRELDGFRDSEEKIEECFELLLSRVSVAAGDNFALAVTSDGNVETAGSNYAEQCDVSEWTDIVAVAAGAQHSLGLKADRTVLATGAGADGQCCVYDWVDIVAITAGKKHSLGLKFDGSVVAVGKNTAGQCDVHDWVDIVAIAAGIEHSLGLKADGTVVAVGGNDYGQCDVSGWTDIVAIAAGAYHTVGLRSDGTVVTAGLHGYEKHNVSDWTEIVAVKAAGNFTVGLRIDGTVVATGENYYGQCNVSDWTDIVAIAAGRTHILGLKSDGTVVAIGANYSGQCDVSDWEDIYVPED